MKHLIFTSLLVSCVICLPPGASGPEWRPVGVNTRTALGAYYRVERAYEGRLIMESLLRAYHKTINYPRHLEGSNVRIVFNARSVYYGFRLQCTANVRRRGSPWLIWYIRCRLRDGRGGRRYQGRRLF